MRWWKYYQETGEAPYKKSEKNKGKPSSFIGEYEQYIQEVVEKNRNFVLKTLFMC